MQKKRRLVLLCETKIVCPKHTKLYFQSFEKSNILNQSSKIKLQKKFVSRF